MRVVRNFCRLRKVQVTVVRGSIAGAGLCEHVAFLLFRRGRPRNHQGMRRFGRSTGFPLTFSLLKSTSSVIAAAFGKVRITVLWCRIAGAGLCENVAPWLLGRSRPAAITRVCCVFGERRLFSTLLLFRITLLWWPERPELAIRRPSGLRVFVETDFCRALWCDGPTKVRQMLGVTAV